MISLFKTNITGRPGFIAAQLTGVCRGYSDTEIIYLFELFWILPGNRHFIDGPFPAQF